MAKTVTTPDVEQYPITLQEFLDQMSDRQVETKASFKRVMVKEGEDAQHLQKAEWQKLFDLFKTKPVGTPWKTWARKGEK